MCNVQCYVLCTYAVVLSSFVQGLTLRSYYSKMSYLQAKKFFYVGNLMAMSLLHGGCGFPYLAPPMYQYLCGVDISQPPIYQLKTYLIIVSNNCCKRYNKDKIKALIIGLGIIHFVS